MCTGIVSSSAPLRRDTPPRVWVLTGHKAGDNTQVTALAEALGWPFETLRFYYRPWELLTNRLLGVTLAGIDRKASSPLQPPWPDLVITAGRRNEPVARWIKRQAPQARLVHVGRPWSPLAAFDLVVTTPQYFLPELPNVLHNRLPLHGLTAARLATAGDAWKVRLQHLPRPWTAVMIGGDSGPYVFTPEKGARLGRRAVELAAAEQGSLLVTSSARTPPAALAAFEAQVTGPAYIHRWASGQTDNPYQAFLALADRLVVTGESMSMLAEACFTGKPLYIFDPGDAGAWWRYRHGYRFKPLSHHFAMRFAPRRLRRDVGNIQRRLVADGNAVWLGETFRPRARSEARGDLENAAARVRALFAG